MLTRTPYAGVLRKRVMVITAILAVATTGIVAYGEEPAVNIDNFTFTPQTLTVPAGTTITWKNKDDIPHTVTSTTKAFKSGALDTDDNFSFTFTTPGVYEYFCSLHPHMTGKIVVEAKTGSSK
jgi:plastocyanin